MDRERLPISGKYYDLGDDNILNLSALTHVWAGTKGWFVETDYLFHESYGTEFSTQKSPEEITGIFNDLVDSGLFIQIGSHIINKKSIQALWSDGHKIKYWVAGSEYSVKTTAKDALDIFDELHEDKKFSSFDNYLINTSKLVNAYKDKHLKVNFTGGTTLKLKSNKYSVEEFFQKLKDYPQFAEVGGEVINIPLAGNVWLDGKRLRIQYPGSKIYVDVGNQAGYALNLFKKQHGFHRIHDEIVNARLLNNAWHQEKGFLQSNKLKFDILNSEMYVSLPHYETPQSFFNALAYDYNFLTVGEHRANINALSRAYYDGKKFRYRIGLDDYSIKTDQNTANKYLDKIMANPKFVDINGTATNIALVSNMFYHKGKLHYYLGPEKYSITMSHGHALEILEDVRAQSIEYEASYTSMPNDQREAWDPDIYKEIYEAIDEEMASQSAMNAAIIASVVINS